MILYQYFVDRCRALKSNHFSCSICGKNYVSRTTLDVHSRWHQSKNTIPQPIQNNRFDASLGNNNYTNKKNSDSNNGGNSNCYIESNCSASCNNNLSNYAIQTPTHNSVDLMAQTFPQSSTNNTTNNSNSNSNNIFDNNCVSAFSQYPLSPQTTMPTRNGSDIEISNKLFQNMSLPVHDETQSNNIVQSRQADRIVFDTGNATLSFSIVLPAAPLPLSAKLNPYGFRQPDCETNQSESLSQSQSIHLNGNNGVSKSVPNQKEIPCGKSYFVSPKSITVLSQPSRPMPPLIPIETNVPLVSNPVVSFWKFEFFTDTAPTA